MSKTLLFGALDWGLGHATRSIPLLNYFKEKGWELVIAANERPKQILQEAFPTAQIVEPPAYNITYSKQPSFITLRLLQQAPKLLRVISEENRWLDQLISSTSVDLILSDNRYGFYHLSIPSWIMTHQLAPMSGWGGLADRLVYQLHQRMLKPFDQILVPDLPKAPGIAGRLSHPITPTPHTHYIGLLSRLSPTFEVPTLEVPTLEVVVVLSGPEPSRTIFEETIRRQLKSFKGRYVLVQGLPNVPQTEPQILPYADPKTLVELYHQAKLIICRSGYSSVMDLLALGKKALLVPTPGQTEQLYLADHLETIGLFPSMRQEAFELEKAIQKAEGFKTPQTSYRSDLYKEIIEELIDESKK